MIDTKFQSKSTYYKLVDILVSMPKLTSNFKFGKSNLRFCSLLSIHNRHETWLDLLHMLSFQNCLAIPEFFRFHSSRSVSLESNKAKITKRPKSFNEQKKEERVVQNNRDPRFNGAQEYRIFFCRRSVGMSSVNAPHIICVAKSHNCNYFSRTI